ncbi:unnamed protein product [Psylliodes chrysocephalus]|uniref:ATP-dependent (S)-NAD(P)H-hydrate dehydratase n=1 Tax=Psylliodes chrysocephalus TaxID=3402493 RepID=A0A9P0CNA4_9CUCU|nr:unnamed protein product [Psylliodes chrysocephala]
MFLLFNVMVILSFASRILTNVNKCDIRTAKNMCESAEKILAQRAAQLAPSLTHELHKGQAGRIGIFGGSIEYTGAPYFSSISTLKVGADLAYVFCNKDAATVIKSYSPELIVLPVLDDSEALSKIEPWLDRLHVILIGPGLGRHNSTFNVIEGVINSCRDKKKPMVIDADGLYLISQKPELLKNYPAPIVLTPNIMEFNRLVGQTAGDGTKLERSTTFFNKLGGNITILCKDYEDEIISNGKSVKVVGGGSGRRCGGQGDLLGGSLSTFLAWAINKNEDPIVACYAAARLTRQCNERAFAKHGRSMTTTNMIDEIHDVFEDNFEYK